MMNVKTENEFYVGYLSKMPPNYSSFIIKTITVIILLVLIVAIVVPFEMEKSVNSRFEYGTLTEIEGILYNSPVPILKVISPENQSIKSILLTNYLKVGARDILSKKNSMLNGALSSRFVKVKGTLIYYDGVAIMELTDKENSIIEITYRKNSYEVKINPYGEVSLRGEIVDSKCFFGAMNPGFGKVHRSCATLCIAGGITPVFALGNEFGGNDYFIMVGRNGQPINNQLLPFVGKQVSLSGKVSKYDDWNVLFVDPNKIVPQFNVSTNASESLSASIHLGEQICGSF